MVFRIEESVHPTRTFLKVISDIKRQVEANDTVSIVIVGRPGAYVIVARVWLSNELLGSGASGQEQGEGEKLGEDHGCERGIRVVEGCVTGLLTSSRIELI